MAKIGYSFDGDRRAIKPRRRKSSAGSWFIAIVLLLVVGGGSYFIFFHSGSRQDKQIIKPTAEVAENMPTSSIMKSEKTPVTEQNIVKTSRAVGDHQPTKVILPPKAVPVPPVPKDNAAIVKLNALCVKASRALAASEYVTARQWMLQALAQPEIKRFSKSWLKAAEILSQANAAIINSDVPLVGKKERYTVAKGDALRKIANKFNTTVEFIQRGNGMKKNNYIVWEGQELKIYHGKWRIEISKKQRILMLYDGDELFKIYHICIGKQNRTPEGKFIIVSKKKNPTWYKSKKEIIPFGTKENVLGTRWMALRSTEAKNRNLTGYGIHGTWDNDSIGKARSNGCIRMRNSDVEELFSIVPYKTEVIIKK